MMDDEQSEKMEAKQSEKKRIIHIHIPSFGLFR